MESCERSLIFIFSFFGSRNLDNMELNVLSDGMVLILSEKNIVIEATMFKVISGVVIIWNIIDTPLLFQVKVEKSIIILARKEINIIKCSNMEVFVCSLD